MVNMPCIICIKIRVDYILTIDLLVTRHVENKQNSRNCSAILNAWSGEKSFFFHRDVLKIEQAQIIISIARLT